MDLVELLKTSVSKYPDKTAAIQREKEVSYREVEESSNKIARFFWETGIKAGDRLAIILPNSPEFLFSYFGIIKIGAIAVPLNFLLKGEEVKFILKDSGAKGIIGLNSFLEPLISTFPEIKTIKYVVSVGESYLPGSINLNQILSQKEGRFFPPSPDSEMVAALLYTSGTTGKPKGAMLTHHNLTWDALACGKAVKITPRDRFVSVLPLFHAFGAAVCMLVPLATGGSMVLLEKFTPEGVVEAISRYRATIFAGVPSMYLVLLHLPPGKEREISYLRLCISGGSALPLEVMEKFEARFKVPILEGDGPTECSPVVSVNPLEGKRKPGSVGLPLEGVEVKIIDLADRELPPNEVGEIVVKGPNVMKGYYQQESATAEVLKEGWFYTGDLGKMDEEGYLYIVGRKKELIIVGGLNVYPREVEEVLYQHPKIAEAAVIGSYDQRRGEVVKAFIVLKEGEKAEDKEIIAYCRERLASFKVPRKIEFRDSLPKSSIGKVLKRYL